MRARERAWAGCPGVGREVDDDLVRDITEVLTSMCARLYGRRSAKRRAERAVKAAAEDEAIAAV